MGQCAWGIILASGKDQQISAEADTAFLSIGSQPVLMYSILAFEACPDIECIVVIARKDRMESVVNMVNMFGVTKVRKIAASTAQRRASIQAGLDTLEDDVTLVTVHEASRPCITPELISDTLKAAKRYGCGIAAAKWVGPVRETEKGLTVSGAPDSTKLWSIQTPQSFKRDLIQEAIANAIKKKVNLVEESEAVSLLKKPVHLVASSRTNMKITEPDDLKLAAVLVGDGPSS